MSITGQKLVLTLLAKLTILGSGTSTGVPMIGCSCDVCCSDDPKDHRTRASILLQDDNATTNILIDTGPDLRKQMLRSNVKKLKSVLYTHYHYDHLGGLNDLRPFSFRQEGPLDCYCNEQTKIRYSIYTHMP